MRFHSLVKFVCACTVLSCTPTPFLRENTEEPVKVAPSSEARAAQASQGLPRETVTSSDSRKMQIELYLRLTDFRTAISVSEIQQLRKIEASNERGPLARAVLLFGALRSYAKYGVDEATFEQAILLEQIPLHSFNWTKASSLEDLLSKLQISYRNEMDSNPFVQNLNMLELTAVLKEQSQAADTPFLSEEFLSVLNMHAQRWIALGKRISSDAENAHILSESTPSQNTSPVEAEVGTEQAEFTSYPSSDTELLQKSAELAEKNRFVEAITLLRKVSPQSAYAGDVKKQIKVIANKAVQELRTLSARAYQRAIPMQDLQARTEYLTQAQQYLVQALENFPESDQLEAVKQNLQVIQKKLEVIQGK